MWHALCARFCQLAWPRIADGIFQKMLNSPRHGTLREGAPFPPPSLCLSLYFRGKSLINAVAHTHTVAPQTMQGTNCELRFRSVLAICLFSGSQRTTPTPAPTTATTLLVYIKNLSRNFNSNSLHFSKTNTREKRNGTSSDFVVDRLPAKVAKKNEVGKSESDCGVPYMERKNGKFNQVISIFFIIVLFFIVVEKVSTDL